MDVISVRPTASVCTAVADSDGWATSTTWSPSHKSRAAMTLEDRLSITEAQLTFLGAFLSFLARAFFGFPSLLSLAGFSLGAAFGALAFLGAGLASEDGGRFLGFGAASCAAVQFVSLHTYEEWLERYGIGRACTDQP